MKLKPDDEDISKTYKEIGPYLGLGLQLAITVVVMIFLGIWVDGEFETTPVFTIIGSVIGIFAGMYNFIKSVSGSSK